MSSKRAKWVSVGSGATLSMALLACSAPPPAQAPEPLTADPPGGAAGAQKGEATTELQRGVAFLKNQKWDEARPHFEKAIADDPKNAEPVYYLAITKEGLKDYAGAEADYKKAIALDPKLAEAAQNLAALYLDPPQDSGNKPRPDDAIPLLKDALAKQPDNVALMTNLAFAYSLSGDTDKSAKAYEAVLAKGDSAKVRFDYGAMLLDAKQPERAAEQLEKALEGTGEDAPMLATLGRMLGFAKDFKGCVKAFDRAVEVKNEDPEWLVRRGTCKHELKDEPGARADFEASISKNPQFAAGHYYLGVSLLADNRRTPGIAELEKAVKLGEGTPVGKLAAERLAAAKAGKDLAPGKGDKGGKRK